MSGSPIIRSDDLRAENRYRILQTLRRDGPLPRAELGQRTDLSPAAISTLIGALIGDGALETTSATAPDSAAGRDVPARRGRPRTHVSLRAASAHVLSAELMIDRLRLALVDYAGNESAVREHALDTRALGAEALLGAVGERVAALVAETPGVARIGVAFQGTTDNASGALLWSPVTPAREVPLGTALERRFGVPTSVANDCALIARALHRAHADTLGESFATVLFSHGVGLGLTLEGQPFTGIRSSALEIGHLPFERDGALCRCGRRGCIEAYAADYAIVRLAAGEPIDRIPPGRVTVAELDRLAAAARAGERGAAQAFEIAGAAVGEGLAVLFTLLDPMPVALVGRTDAAFTLMAEGLYGALDARGPGGAGALSLHCFADDGPLLHAGLALDTLDALDRSVAAGGETRRARAATAGQPSGASA